jgi:hypothetical protein
MTLCSFGAGSGSPAWVQIRVRDQKRKKRRTQATSDPDTDQDPKTLCTGTKRHPIQGIPPPHGHNRICQTAASIYLLTCLELSPRRKLNPRQHLYLKYLKLHAVVPLKSYPRVYVNVYFIITLCQPPPPTPPHCVTYLNYLI